MGVGTSMTKYLLDIDVLSEVNQYTKHIHGTGDAGIDLYFPHSVRIGAGDTLLIDFEIRTRMKHILDPKTLEMEEWSYMLVPRSSIWRTPLRQSNGVGIIDSGYRGHIMVPVDNMSNQSYEVKRGERLFQIVSPTLGETMVQFTKLTTDTKRGTGGFGSTGK